MNQLNPSRRASLLGLASLTLLIHAHATEITVDPPGPGASDLAVGADQTVWFDSGNTNTPVAVSTINGAAPAVGFLPGWAHTRWSFLKYDGANVIEIPDAEKVLGPGSLSTATATSDYYDSMAQTSLIADQSIGLLETTRDFLINDGVTLNVAQSGLIYHNANHWVKAAAGTAFITSSTGRLVVIANGGGTDYQLNTVVVKDFDATLPLQFVKTGPDQLALSANNTYTGGTRIHNGRLMTNFAAGYGTGTVKVVGGNSQAYPQGAATYANNFEIEGLGWVEATGQFGALRLNNGTNLTGTVTLTGDTRIGALDGSIGTLSGTLSGTDALEINATTPATVNGTINLNGSAAGYTGTATVSQGRLNVNNAFGGAVSVRENAGLGGESTIAGNVDIGGTSAAPSVLYADGSTPGALAVAGDFEIASATNLVANGFPASPATSFTALTYNTLSGNFADLKAAGFRNATLTNDTANKAIIVNFTPGSIVWTGATNATWAQNTDQNFTTGSPTSFFAGDRVTFDESATVKTLALSGIVYPGSVTFNATSDYTLNGPAAGIGGGATITKSGTGTVSFGGELSSFTGAITVNAGRLKPINGQALGYSSGITIAAGGQLDLNGQPAFGVGRGYSYTIAGAGPDGTGAITNTAAANLNEGAGVMNITLSGDASIGSSAGRFDFGNAGGVQGTLTGNNHTLTKIGTTGMGFRADASGSPVHFVIAAGNAWGENNDNAWGGATGTLTVKNGARAGTYGTRSIATPVTLEDGATLYNEGNGAGTWTGPVTVSGNATLEANTAVILEGPVTGAAAVTKTGGNTLTVDQPGWTGDTTVSAGILELGQATLADGYAVSINGDTTQLALNFTGQDTVKYLYIDGVPQPIGVYDATSLPDHITGSGALNVTAVGSSGYAGWEAANGIAGAGGAADSDEDGISNGIEFVIGGDPSGPDSNSNALLPTVTTDATSLIFQFRRSTLSMAEPAARQPYVEYGSDLTGWTTAIDGTAGVTIAVGATEVAPGIFPVTVTIPLSLANGNRIFARLRVDIP